MKIGIIGGGSFGKALFTQLEYRHEAVLWKRGDDLEEAVSGKECLIFAIPAQSFREVFAAAAKYIGDDCIVINGAKGLEKGTNLRLSEIAKEIKPDVKYVCMSGPSHAENVAELLPTAVVVASDDPELAVRAQDILFSNRFRVYTNDDLIGIELCGALKNVIALGTGISDGMMLGDNCKAAILTRGMAEIKRLGMMMGADESTFIGLAGMGDLVVTCTSVHSRNRRCGIMIGQGIPAFDAAARVGMVVEGIHTVDAAYDMSHKLDVEMPIVDCIYRLVHDEIDAFDAVEILLGRDRKQE